jgi:acetyltransferase-like isoleucine patch superfamily enzyme
MKSLVESAIKSRNKKFLFDAALTDGMLWQFVWSYFWRLFRGCLVIFRFRNPRWIMLGAGVRIANLSRVKWGRFLKLDDNVYLNALGTKGIEFGHNVGIGAFSRIVISTSLNNIGRFIKIGDNVGIGEFAYLGGAGGVEIGNDTIIGQYFSCHAENHIYTDPDALIRHQGVSRKGIAIGANCWIGSKVTILDGVNLGDGSVVAAGSVVTRSFANNSVIGGVPAKLIKQRI